MIGYAARLIGRLIGRLTGFAATVGLCAAAAPVWAESPAPPVLQDPILQAPILQDCSVDPALLVDRSNLGQSWSRLKNARRLTILAIGSSSTLGVGLSPAGRPWPSLLQAELTQRYPRTEITIVNRGLERQTAQAMLERMPGEIAATHPDLVIWEVGTAEAVRGADLSTFRNTLLTGVETVHRAAADLLLIDPQYTRMNDLLFVAEPYVKTISEVASQEDLVVFHRNDVMRAWADDGRLNLGHVQHAKALLADRVHACWAQLLAGLITTTAR